MKTRFRFEKLEVWQDARGINRALVKRIAAVNRSLAVETTKTPFARRTH
jgi:hypothetical protein